MPSAALADKHARPLTAALKRWFEVKLDHLAHKSDTAKALRHALHHWNGLTLYLDDGDGHECGQTCDAADQAQRQELPFCRLRRGQY